MIAQCRRRVAAARILARLRPSLSTLVAPPCGSAHSRRDWKSRGFRPSLGGERGCAAGPSVLRLSCVMKDTESPTTRSSVSLTRQALPPSPVFQSLAPPHSPPPPQCLEPVPARMQRSPRPETALPPPSLPPPWQCLEPVPRRHRHPAGRPRVKRLAPRRVSLQRRAASPF